MDTLYWNNIRLGMTYHDVSKQYYGKYLWKLVMNVPGGRLIYTKQNLKQAYSYRMLPERFVNWGGSWMTRRNSVPVDFELLQILKSIHDSPEISLKFRVEEPKMQVYAEHEHDLKDFVQAIPEKYHYLVEELHGVSDLNQAKILKSDAIITNLAAHWKFKIIVRDTLMHEDSMKAMLNLLHNLTSEIKPSAKFVKHLEQYQHRTQSIVWGGFVYTNDDNVAVLMNLIEPGIVRKIHPLVLGA